MKLGTIPSGSLSSAAGGLATLAPTASLRGKLTVIHGPKNTGKSTQLINFCKEKLIDRGEPVFVCSPRFRGPLQAHLDTVLRVGVAPHVDSGGAMARRILESPLGALQGAPDLSTLVVEHTYTKSERETLLRRCIPTLPLTVRFRPMSDPAKYQGHIADYFTRLIRLGVSPEAYLAWADNIDESAGVNEIDGKKRSASKDAAGILDKDAHAELAATYSAFWKEKLNQGAIDADAAVYLAYAALRQRSKVPESRELLMRSMFEGFAATQSADPNAAHIAVDEADRWTPCETRLVAEIASILLEDSPNSSGLIAGDFDEEELEKPHLLVSLASERVKAVPRATPTIAAAPILPRPLIPWKKVDGLSYEDAHYVEMDVLANWCKTQHKAVRRRAIQSGSKEFVRPKIFVACRSSLDRELVATSLEARGIKVVVADKRESLWETHEVRLIRAIVRAALAPDNTSEADRELYLALTSPLTRYKPTPEELAVYHDGKVKRLMSTQEALALIPSGRQLLADISAFKEAALTTDNVHRTLAKASELTAVILDVTGITAKLGLKDTLTEEDARSERRLTHLLDQLMRVERRSRGMDDAAHVFQELEQATGAALGYTAEEEDAETSPEIVPIVDVDIEENLANPSRVCRVILSTFHGMHRAAADYSLDALALARCSDTKFPSRRPAQRFPLPSGLVRVPRPMDGVGPLGPFPPEEDSTSSRGAHLEREAILLTLMRDKLKPSALVERASESFVYTVRPGEKPSRYVLSEDDRLLKQVTEEVKLVLSSPAATSAPEPDAQAAPSPEVLEPLVLSYSSMSEYETCPLKWHTHRRAGVKSPATPPLIYGKALHAGVETFLSVKKGDGMDEAVAAYLKEYDDAFKEENRPLPVGFESKAHISIMRARGLLVLSEFCERNRARAKNVVRVEHGFEFAFENNIRVKGFIDLTEDVEDSKSGGKLRKIVDFKSNTADARKLASLGRNNAQLALYGWAHREEFGVDPDIVALESLETGQQTQTKPSKELEEEVRRRIRDVAKGIRSGNFEATPTSFGCTYCGLKDTCPKSATRG